MIITDPESSIVAPGLRILSAKQTGPFRSEMQERATFRSAIKIIYFNGVPFLAISLFVCYIHKEEILFAS